jgi:hypothetical protein
MVFVAAGLEIFSEETRRGQRRLLVLGTRRIKGRQM